MGRVDVEMYRPVGMTCAASIWASAGLPVLEILQRFMSMLTFSSVFFQTGNSAFLLPPDIFSRTI